MSDELEHNPKDELLEDGTETPLEESLFEALNEDERDWPQLAVVDEESLPEEVAEQLEVAREDFGANPDEVIEIEELEFVEVERVQSIVESILFATDKPVSLATIKQAFQGTSVKTDQIRRALDALAVEYAGVKRGVTIEEVSSGYQLRTKVDNMTYMRNMIKLRPFKLSGPALETLSIIAYKQPCVKAEIDEIRGVESGHLLRALMEKGLVSFAGKSDLPGKPMQYQTTRKFLEIFGLRNIRELPTLSEIDDLLPEGIGPAEEKKETLDMITGELSEQVTDASYSAGEDELLKITAQLSEIETSSQFFEDEKARQKAKRDQERAQDLRDALAVGEAVEPKDAKWLERYEAEQRAAVEQAQAVIEAAAAAKAQASEATEAGGVEAVAAETVDLAEVEAADAGDAETEAIEVSEVEPETIEMNTAEVKTVVVEALLSAAEPPAGATFHPEKTRSSVELATEAALKAFEEDLDEEEGFSFARVEEVKADKDDSEQSGS